MYHNKTFYIFYNNKWNEGEDAEKIINRIISEDIYNSILKYIDKHFINKSKRDASYQTLRRLTGTKTSILHSMKEHLMAVVEKPTFPIRI